MNVDAFLCSKMDCKTEMNCGESIFRIEDDDLLETTCRARTDVPGLYRVQTHVSYLEDEDVERSKEFFVYASEEAMLAGQRNIQTGEVIEDESEIVQEINYVCTGNLRQAVFTSGSETKVSDIEFCPFGCSQGRCTTTSSRTTAAAGTPVIKQMDKFSDRPQFNPPVYDLSNFLDWLKNLLFSKPS